MKFEQPYYICAICGKQHRKIEDRITCETKCLAQRQADEEKRKKHELEVAKQAKRDEIDKAYRAYLDLIDEYVEKYGNYCSVRKISNNETITQQERQLIQELLADII